MNLMKSSEKYTTIKLLLISLISTIIIIYPNLTSFTWTISFMDDSAKTWYTYFFIFRYFYFALLFWILLYMNQMKMQMVGFKQRLIRTLLIAVPAFAAYALFSFTRCHKYDFISIVIYQFFAVAVICVFAGHLFMIYRKHRIDEQEIEQLKIENLQSRCEALANQINPHFFFNSLNGIASLIRKKNDEDALSYVNTLSDVFHYILQSEKKGLVALEEELEFLDSFRYMMGMRYANKLSFDIEVDQSKMNLQIPVLSLLPLIDNVIVHNRIDSEHIMVITIRMNEKDELVVSNPIYEKLTPADTNGTGLKNLENRFALMLNKVVRIENDGKTFRAYLPLK